MPTSPTPDGEGFWFDFPVFDRATANTMPAREIPSVHYVTRPGKVMPAGTMRATFEIHGGPFWATEVPDETPAKVRLFFQRSGDDWAGSPGRTEFYRWWGALADLVPGRSTLEALLVPEKWGSVMGKRGADNSAAFHEAIANIARIGLTFGGGYAGHGVYAVAAARFRLRRSVAPHIGQAIAYLNVTASGRQWIANLHNHVFCVEHSSCLMGPTL